MLSLIIFHVHQTNITTAKKIKPKAESIVLAGLSSGSPLTGDKGGEYMKYHTDV